MTVIFGKSEAEDRMRRDTMTPNNRVALDHDFYSENPEINSKKSKEIKQIEYDGQDDKQYRMKKATGGHMHEDDDEREKYAIGGVAKLRKGYPLTEGN